MYRIDLQVNLKWEYYYENENLKEIDKVVFKLVHTNENQYIRILEDNVVLLFLKLNEYQYWYFKNMYVRNKEPEFDIVASYYNWQKKKELKKEDE